MGQAHFYSTSNHGIKRIISDNFLFAPVPYGHVITADLNIVEDREVKTFLKKEPKYRPPSIIDWNQRCEVIKNMSFYCKS